MGYWLMKTEPGEWGWEHQDQNGGTSQWDGVRNALAQIHLRSMREGDHAFFYHSGKGPAVVGVVEIVKAAYPDVSDDTGKSIMVDVRALAAFPQPVPLSVIKSDDAMRDWILLRQSRLSVLPVSPDVWRRVCALGELSPPLCRTTDDDDEDAIAAVKPARKMRPRKRGKGDAGAQTQSAKQKSSVNAATDIVNLEERELSPPLCQTTDDDEGVIADVRLARKTRSRRRGEADAGTQMQSAKQKTRVNVAAEIVKVEEQSSVTDVAAFAAELKTYQRCARKRSASIEPSVVKTYKSRRVKKLPGDDTKPSTLNPKL